MIVMPAPFIERMREASKNGSSSSSAFRASEEREAARLLLRPARFVVAVPERADWASALDEMAAAAPDERGRRFGSEWRQRITQLPCPQAGVFGGVREEHVHCDEHARDARGSRRMAAQGSGAIIGTYRWYAKRELARRRLHAAFDYFVYTRPDYYLLCTLPLPLPLLRSYGGRDANVAMVPQGEDWGPGLNDRLIVCTARSVDTCLTTIEAWVLGARSHPFLWMLQNERLLRASLVAACVRLVRLPAAGLLAMSERYDGRHNGDFSRWSRCRVNATSPLHAPLARHRLCAKYGERPLIAARKTCGM